MISGMVREAKSRLAIKIDREGWKGGIDQVWVELPRRTEPWGPFSIHFTALKMNPFKRTTSFVPAHVPAAPGPA